LTSNDAHTNDDTVISYLHLIARAIVKDSDLRRPYNGKSIELIAM
jgi:hypothetical protein